MSRRIASIVFLIDSVIMGLGSIGHGYSVRHLHEAIDKLPIDPVISQTLYIVWYSVSGTQLLFGAILIWIWLKVRAGDRSSLPIANLIGIFNLFLGICAIVYRHGDPFWSLFIVLGALLLASSFVLRTSPALNQS